MFVHQHDRRMVGAPLATKRVLRDLMSSRLFAAAITVVMLLWRAGWEANAVFVNGLVSAAIMVVMLHTQTGRRLLTLCWLILLAAAILGFFYFGLSLRAFEVLGIVLAWGAMFFVDWRSVSRYVAGAGQPASAGRRRPVPRRTNKKTAHMDCTVGWRHPWMG